MRRFERKKLELIGGNVYLHLLEPLIGAPVHTSVMFYSGLLLQPPKRGGILLTVSFLNYTFPLCYPDLKYESGIKTNIKTLL